MGGGFGVTTSVGKEESALPKQAWVVWLREDRGTEQQGAKLVGVVFKDVLGNWL